MYPLTYGSQLRPVCLVVNSTAREEQRLAGCECYTTYTDIYKLLTAGLSASKISYCDTLLWA